ncbi:hypothetical protein ACVIIV_005772 [Bradyrhizobium sp. USDA 4354]
MSPSVTLLGKPRPAFQVCGYTGLLLAFVQSSVLVAYLGLSQLTLLGMTGVVILTFLGLTMITKIIVGHELIIYYRHEIAVIVMVTVFLRGTGQAVLPYLDVAILGVGLFLALGRVGCLMVGCCHGQPWRWGVTYGHEHVAAGFAEHLEGVQLFPIQAVESGFALLIVVTGIVAIIEGYPPGTAFTFYVLVYAAGRFCFEFFRGGSTRPYLWGFFEAQWISLSIATADVWAEHAGLVPSYRWHAAGADCDARNRTEGARRMAIRIRFVASKAHPRISGSSSIVERRARSLQFSMSLPPQSGSNAIHVVNTSLGIRISTGELTHGSHLFRHYSLSQDAAPLSASSARLLATTIAHLHHPSCSFELVSGESGVFHMMFGPDRARSTSRVRSGNRARVPRSRTSVRAEGLRGW